MRLLLLTTFCLVFFLCLAAPAHAQESLDHLPVPRWATLSSDDTNLRSGPGTRYPIDWVLKKKDLPVEVIQEFDHWRRIREPGGSDGWVNKLMLSGVRHAMMKEDVVLRRNPANDASAVAKLRRGVLGKIKQCQKEWCEVKVDSYEGWAAKTALWGVYKDENF